MNVPLTAGLVVGIFATVFQFTMGSIVLTKFINKAKANGEVFVAHPSDVFDDDEENTPNGYLSLIPLIATLIVINIKVDGVPIIPLEYGVGIGVILTILILNKHIDNSKITYTIGEGVKSATTMIFSTCAVVGFGSVVKVAPAFADIVDFVLNMGGSPLIGAALGTTLIAGVTGSASGGLGIAAPLLAPSYLAQTAVSHGAIARVMALSSSALDSLPHNGAVVAVIDCVCQETHKSAYFPIFILSVVCPIITTIVAIVGFTILPNLP